MSSSASFIDRDKTDRWIQLWNQTEGRDKISKCIQYGSRFLAWYLNKKSEWIPKLQGLQAVTGDSRKIFRLGKFINEYAKIRQTVRGLSLSPKNKFNSDDMNKLINDSLLILSRTGFMIYWIYDGLNILSKIKFLKGDTKKLIKRAALAWFIGLIAALALELRKLHALVQQHREATTSAANLCDLTSQLQSQSGSGVDSQATGSRPQRLDASATNTAATTKPLSVGAHSDSHTNAVVSSATENKFRNDRRTILLNIVKVVGDLMPASHLIELPQTLTGKSLNDGAVGLGGFVAALLTLYQMYPPKAQHIKRD